MKKNTYFILLISFLLLAGVAYFLYNNQPKETDSEPQPQQEAPVVTTSDKYTSTTQGYSLNLTENFKVAEITDIETVFIHISENPEYGISWIITEPAQGRTADEVAQALVTDQVEGINLDTTTITLDGEPAVVIKSAPGQYLTRHVYVVHNDTLYKMGLTPDDPQLGEAYGQMDEFYNTIVDTFRFNE